MLRTSRDHVPIAIEAAQAGLHVLTEKPVALCSRDGHAVIAAGAGHRGGARGRDDEARRPGIRAGDQMTRRAAGPATGPNHYAGIAVRALRGALPAGDRASSSPGADREAQGGRGTGARRCGAGRRRNDAHLLPLVLTGQPHLRGQPPARFPRRARRITFAALDGTCVSVNRQFAAVECHLSWVGLLGIAHYHQELALRDADSRLTLRFPSPFLRNAPTELFDQGRNSGHERQLEAARGGRRRRGLQERADRVPRVRRDPEAAAHLGPGRPRDPLVCGAILAYTAPPTLRSRSTPNAMGSGRSPRVSRPSSPAHRSPAAVRDHGCRRRARLEPRMLATRCCAGVGLGLWDPRRTRARPLHTLVERVVVTTAVSRLLMTTSGDR